MLLCLLCRGKRLQSLQDPARRDQLASTCAKLTHRQNYQTTLRRLRGLLPGVHGHVLHHLASSVPAQPEAIIHHPACYTTVMAEIPKRGTPPPAARQSAYLSGHLLLYVTIGCLLLLAHLLAGTAAGFGQVCLLLLPPIRIHAARSGWRC